MQLHHSASEQWLFKAHRNGVKVHSKFSPLTLGITSITIET